MSFRRFSDPERHAGAGQPPFEALWAPDMSRCGHAERGLAYGLEAATAELLDDLRRARGAGPDRFRG